VRFDAKRLGLAGPCRLIWLLDFSLILPPSSILVTCFPAERLGLSWLRRQSRAPVFFPTFFTLLYFTFLPPSVRLSLSSLILARLLCLFFFFFSSSTSSLAIHIVFLDVVILCINSILVSNEVTTSFYYESLPRPLRPLLVPCVIFQTLRFSCSRSLPQISDLPGSSLAMSYLF
jgi:hypothetical protein